MITLSFSVCVDAPAAKVWAALSELESIHLYVEAITSAYCVSEQTRGIGAVRVCELGRHVAVRETIVAWDEGRSFAYVAEGFPLMKRGKNVWSIEAQGAQTLVTSLAELEIRGGVLGRLLEPALAPILRRTGPTSLASFKYLVEHGRPYSGSVRKLLPVPTSC